MCSRPLFISPGTVVLRGRCVSRTREEVCTRFLLTLSHRFSSSSKTGLNACYSDLQAKEIAKHIDYVIGMNEAIDDRAAIAFAIGFYQGLGAGRTIDQAYKLGCVQIILQGAPGHLIPVLSKRI